MDPKIKKRIQSVLDDACHLADSGMDEREAAREALKAQVTDVYRELAIAAIVGNIRAKARAKTLQVEREAMGERRAKAKPSQTWKTPEYYARQGEIERRHAQRMRAIVEDYAADLKAEWTQELLDSRFTLPDGTEVTWGDATIEQHETRAAQFERNAMVNAEGAARHRQALAELSESGCATLREAVAIAA